MINLPANNIEAHLVIRQNIFWTKIQIESERLLNIIVITVMKYKPLSKSVIFLQSKRIISC